MSKGDKKLTLIRRLSLNTMTKAVARQAIVVYGGDPDRFHEWEIELASTNWELHEVGMLWQGDAEPTLSPVIELAAVLAIENMDDNPSGLQFYMVTEQWNVCGPEKLKIATAVLG